MKSFQVRRNYKHEKQQHMDVIFYAVAYHEPLKNLST